MKKLDLSGTIEYEDEIHKFSLKNGFLTLFDRIKKVELRRIFPTPDYSLDIVLGVTDTGQAICFLDSRLVNNHEYQIFSPKAIIIGKKNFTKETSINSIRLTGGSLNNLGDIIEEIILQPDEELDKYKRGIASFKFKSFEETNVAFKDEEINSNHKYIFSVNRQFLLTDKTIKDFNRSLYYESVTPFTLTDVMSQLLDMIDFIKLLSWKNSVSISKVTLGKLRDDKQNYPFANLFFNLPEEETSIINVSISDYNNDNNSLGKLYSINKSLKKSHLFLLNGLHLLESYDSKDILNSVITLEQIIDHFEIEKSRMNESVKNLRNSIIKDYQDNPHFEELKMHLVNYRGNTLKQTIFNILEENHFIVDSFLKNIPDLDRDRLILHLENTIKFRNDVVHSSKFNIESDGVGIGAFFFTYTAYFLILLKAEYTPEETTSILKKLFRFHT